MFYAYKHACFNCQVQGLYPYDSGTKAWIKQGSNDSPLPCIS